MLQVLASTHKDVLCLVQAGRVDRARDRDFLHLLKGAGLVGDNLGASGNSEDIAFLGKLNPTDGGVKVNLLDLPSGRCVPHSHSLVVAAGEQLLVVRSVHHLFYPRGVPLKLDDWLRRLLEVKDPEHFVIACSRNAALSLLKLTDLTMCLCWRVSSSSPLSASHTLAEKSAAPVAAFVASLLTSTPHTAPL